MTFRFSKKHVVLSDLKTISMLLKLSWLQSLESYFYHTGNNILVSRLRKKNDNYVLK